VTELAQCLADLETQFEAANLEFGHGTDNAWDEAVALTLGVLNWTDERQNLTRQIPVAAMSRIEALARRRVDERMPLAHLLGFVQFAGLKFAVEAGVMIPRSPIAELINQGFKPWLVKEPLRILDLCAGNGCIGISCAVRFPDAQVDLVEIDSGAAALAERNLHAHKLAARVRVLVGDLFSPVTGPYDLIVSNPPYVPTAETLARAAEFKHEPRLAYDGGADGLGCIRRIIDASAGYLCGDGLLVVETGQFAPSVVRHWPDLGFVWPDFEMGGEGVFMLAATELAEHTS